MTAALQTALPRPADEQLGIWLELIAKPSDGILVAVSGGSDSVALLAAATRVWPQVRAVHVHHGLRLRADRDARATASLCAKLGVPLETVSAPPKSDSDRSETSARQRRLAVLSAMAERQGLAWILTGHHLDDALETALLNLSRGHRGTRALAGIPSLRVARWNGGPRGPRYLRPFLCGDLPLGRGELSAWRESQGLGCVHDESNDDLSIPRNALRSLLAQDRAPLTRARLGELRAEARSTLQRQLARAVESLARHLSREGLGVRLDSAAFGPSPSANHLLECLRLLGPCLRPRHQLTLRGTILERLRAALSRESGQLLLPALPAPLVASCHPDGLRFPDVTLTEGDPLARVLGALWETPLHL